MLITIEGPSCSGKTTLCQALKHNFKDCLVVGQTEINDMQQDRAIQNTEITFDHLMRENPVNDLDHIALQIRFAHLVSRRLNTIQHFKLMGAKDKLLVVADRDISSFYAHSRARLYDSGSSAKRVLSELIRYVWSQHPVIPDLYVYLQTPREVCLERARVRDQEPRDGIANALYFERLSEGYQHIVEARGEGYSLTLGGLESHEVMISQIQLAMRDVTQLNPILPPLLMNNLVSYLRN